MFNILENKLGNDIHAVSILVHASMSEKISFRPAMGSADKNWRNNHKSPYSFNGWIIVHFALSLSLSLSLRRDY